MVSKIFTRVAPVPASPSTPNSNKKKNKKKNKNNNNSNNANANGNNNSTNKSGGENGVAVVGDHNNGKITQFLKPLTVDTTRDVQAVKRMPSPQTPTASPPATPMREQLNNNNQNKKQKNESATPTPTKSPKQSSNGVFMVPATKPSASSKASSEANGNGTPNGNGVSKKSTKKKAKELKQQAKSALQYTELLKKEDGNPEEGQKRQQHDNNAKNDDNNSDSSNDNSKKQKKRKAEQITNDSADEEDPNAGRTQKDISVDAKTESLLQATKDLLPRMISFRKAKNQGDSGDDALKKKHLRPVLDKNGKPTALKEWVTSPKPEIAMPQKGESKLKSKLPALTPKKIEEEMDENDPLTPISLSDYLFPPEQILRMMTWSRPLKIGSGFHNLGNTCFMNAALQCLTYTPPLANFLMTRKLSQGSSSGFNVLDEMSLLVKKALTQSGSTIAPSAIAKNLKSISKVFRLGRQEDSHELLINILDKMENSILAPYKGKIKPRRAQTNPIQQIFGGFLQSQIKSLQESTSKYVSNTYDPFIDLSLDIAKVSSVEKALEVFTTTEILDGKNKYKCPISKKYVRAAKQFTIHRAPNCLMIHLKRFDWTGRKINKHIQFSPELDLKPYMSKESKTKYKRYLDHDDYRYQLYGVLVHMGSSANSGHYYSYVKSPSGIWHLMDDSHVSQVGLQRVLKEQAYILFYIREKPPSSPSPYPMRHSIEIFEQAAAAINPTKEQQQSSSSSTTPKSAKKPRIDATPSSPAPTTPAKTPTKASSSKSASESSTPSIIDSLRRLQQAPKAATTASPASTPNGKSNNNNNNNNKQKKDEDEIVEDSASTSNAEEYGKRQEDSSSDESSDSADDEVSTDNNNNNKAATPANKQNAASSGKYSKENILRLYAAQDKGSDSDDDDELITMRPSKKASVAMPQRSAIIERDGPEAFKPEEFFDPKNAAATAVESWDGSSPAAIAKSIIGNGGDHNDNKKRKQRDEYDQWYDMGKTKKTGRKRLADEQEKLFNRENPYQKYQMTKAEGKPLPAQRLKLVKRRGKGGKNKMRY